MNSDSVTSLAKDAAGLWDDVTLGDARASSDAVLRLRAAIEKGQAVSCRELSKALALQQLLRDAHAVDKAAALALHLIETVQVELGQGRSWAAVAERVRATDVLERALFEAVAMLGTKAESAAWFARVERISLARQSLLSTKAALEAEHLKQQAGDRYRL